MTRCYKRTLGLLVSALWLASGIGGPAPNFTGSNFTGSNFTGSNFTGSDFTEFDSRSPDLPGWDLPGWDLPGWDLVQSGFTSVAKAGAPSQPWYRKAPAWKHQGGRVLRVSTAGQLAKAAESARPGTTILLADGRYLLKGTLVLRASNLTLCSASGDRDRVILQGANPKLKELIFLAGDGITLASLTVENAVYNAVMIASLQGAKRITLYDCVFHNCWQRAVKSPLVPENQQAKVPIACKIQYCLFYNDRAKQYGDDPSDTSKTFRGNYVGGIDIKNAQSWIISDNVFLGIQGRTRAGRGAIFLWDNCYDCVVQRNVITDCDVGIALGNPSSKRDWPNAVKCIVRNNFLTRTPETGILACRTHRCQILNNTIHDPKSRFRRLIFVQEQNTELEIAHNLLSGPPVQVDSKDRINQRNNFVAKDLTAAFFDAATGDLHLRGRVLGVVNAAGRSTSVTDDIDGQPRKDQPDIGADELGRPSDSARPSVAATVPSARTPRPPETAGPARSTGSSRAAGRLPSPEPRWARSMRAVHRRFQGRSGQVAQFGDSMTSSNDFWVPTASVSLAKYLSDDGLPRLPASGKRWRDVILGQTDKGARFGNAEGWKIRDLLSVADTVLEDRQPEVALIMIGTADVSDGRLPRGFARDLDALVRKCLKAGCVPILNTIPPRRGRELPVLYVNKVIRDAALRLRVPLVDYYAQIVRRRPSKSWHETLIDSDGSPSAGRIDDFRSANLKKSGQALRTWSNFLVYRQVYFYVLHRPE